MDAMTDKESLNQRIRMVAMMEEISELPKDEADQFVRAILMVGSCFLNRKNHGVFCLVENEEMLKIMGVNSSFHETGHIVAQAAEMIVTNLHASDLHRKGETH